MTARDIIIRALKTFVQAALAAVTVGAITDTKMWVAAVIAGLAAVLSFLQNTFVKGEQPAEDTIVVPKRAVVPPATED